MLLTAKIAGMNASKAKTPIKMPNSALSVSKSKTPIKQANKLGILNGSLRKKQTSKEGNSLKNGLVRYRTKQTYVILQTLEQIYSQLTFNEFQIFPIDEINKAKKNILELKKTLTAAPSKPICRHHKELLNLYCETDKEVICVSCAYKPHTEHREHKIRDVQSMQKVLDFETIRHDDKNKDLRDQLLANQYEVQQMMKQIADSYQSISDFTVGIIEQSIKQLSEIKSEMEKKLNLAHRRTLLVMSRYEEALDEMINHIDSNRQAASLSDLSRYLLLKELTKEAPLIEELFVKFNENKALMDQWRRSKAEFHKIVLKKQAQIVTKVDSLVVTEF